MDLGRGRARAWRGLGAAGACLVTPATAHAIAGGGLPDLGPLLWLAGLLSVACVALAGRRRSAGEIGALMLLTQPVLHVLFAASGHGAPSSFASPAAIPSVEMVLAHVAAAGLLTVLLAGLESVVWTFAALAQTILLTRVRSLLCSPDASTAAVAPPATAARSVSAPALRYLGLAAPHRGPPVVACAQPR